MPRPEQKKIQLTVDGREIEAIEGTMLVDAAKQANVEIPYFCYQPKLGHPVGFLNPMLYGSLQGKGVTHDVTSGNNGSYSAKAGWDSCTGWGSPDGAKLLIIQHAAGGRGLLRPVGSLRLHGQRRARP